MEKLTKRITFVIALLNLTLYMSVSAQTIQQQYWFMGSYKFNMGTIGNPNISKTDLIQTSGPVLDQIINGVYSDANGTPLFYIRENDIFDKDNVSLLGLLYNNQISPSITGSEIAIVPFIDNNYDECSSNLRKWYVFFAQNELGSGGVGTVITSLYCYIITHNPINGQLSATILENANQPYKIVSSSSSNASYKTGIAVSKLFNNKRRLYFLTHDKISLVEIGIPNTTNIQGVSSPIIAYTPPTGQNIKLAANELELSHDGSKLAWSYSVEDNLNNFLWYLPSFSVINIDVITGLSTTTNYPVNTIPNLYSYSNNPDGGYLEFDQSGNHIFLTTGSASSSNGVFRYSISTNGYEIISNTAGLGASQIELAPNGFMYVGCSQCTSYQMIAISSGDNPQVNNNNSLGGGLYLSTKSMSYAYNNMVFNTVLMPDQIDGENYSQITPNIKTNILSFINPNFDPLQPIYITKSLNDASLRFTETGKIIVGSGVELIIQNCSLQAASCADFWEGIELEPNAKLFIINSVIMDAKKGVNSIHNNNYVKITGSTFSKNEKHVVLSNTQDFEITTSSFNANAFLKNTSIYPKLAIELNTNLLSNSKPNQHKIIGCSITGNYTEAGIKITKAIARVETCNFTQITNVAAINSDMQNDKAKLIVQNCSFNNVKSAVTCKNKTELDFLNNLQVNNCTDNAVDVRNNDNTTINIFENRFNNITKSAVYIFNSKNSAIFNILNNQEIVNCGENAVTVIDCNSSELTMNGNLFNNNTKSAILLSNNDDALINIDYQFITNSGLHAIEIGESDGSSINLSDNTINNNSNSVAAIYIHNNNLSLNNNTSISISNGNIGGCGDEHAVKITDNPSSTISISGVTITNNQKSGLYIANNPSSNIVVNNSNISNNNWAGIDIIGCSNSTVSIANNTAISNNPMGAVYMYFNESATISIEDNSNVNFNGFSNILGGWNRSAIFGSANNNATINIKNNQLNSNKGAISLINNKGQFTKLTITNNDVANNIENHSIRVTNCTNAEISILANTFTNNRLSSVFLFNNAGTESKAYINNNTFIAPNRDVTAIPFTPCTAISIEESSPVSSGTTYKQLVVHGNTIGNANGTLKEQPDYGIKTVNVVADRKCSPTYSDPYPTNNFTNKTVLDLNNIYIFSTNSGVTQSVTDYNTGIQVNNSIGINAGNNTINVKENRLWRNRAIHSNNSTRSLYFNNFLTAGRGISGMDNSSWNDYMCNTLERCHTGISWGDHTMRNIGEVHGILGIEARDNSYVNNYEEKHELYAWHYLGGDISNLIQRNQTAWQSSPVVLFEGNWGANNVPLPPNNWALYAGVAPNRCPENGIIINPDEPGQMYTPIDSSNANHDYFTDWQQLYHYERQLKNTGGVYNNFISKLIDLEGLIAIGDYNAADSLMDLMEGNNIYENNLLAVYSIAINRNLPELRILTENELQILTAIAELHPRVGGNGVYSARSLLEFETGQVFVDMEEISRPSGLAVQLDYSYCDGGSLPASFSIKLKDNTNHIYDSIPVNIDNEGLAYIKGKYIVALDPSKTYTFELLPTDLHAQVIFQPLDAWMENIQTITLCTENGGPPTMGKRGETKDDDTNNKASITENVNDIQASLSLYPNPTSSLLNVILPEGIFDIEVYDIRGTLITKIDNVNYKTDINTQHLSEGLYLLKATNHSSGSTHSQKFVIKR